MSNASMSTVRCSEGGTDLLGLKNLFAAVSGSIDGSMANPSHIASLYEVLHLFHVGKVGGQGYK